MDYNMSMVRGDTLSFGIELDDFDQDLDTVFFSCKENYEDASYIFHKSLGDGISKIETGKYVVRVAPEDTKDVTVGQYYYDLEIGANGDIFTVLKGVLDIEFDVTREV